MPQRRLTPTDLTAALDEANDRIKHKDYRGARRIVTALGVVLDQFETGLDLPSIGEHLWWSDCEHSLVAEDGSLITRMRRK